MDKAELARRLRETFQQELADHVDSLTTELLAIEAGNSTPPSPESWTIIFRVTHTLKGASAVVNLDSIRDACHAMEEIFAHYRDHQWTIPEPMTSLLLNTVDAFSDIRDQMQTSQEVDQSVLDDLLAELQQRASEFQSNEQSPRAETPSPADSESRRAVAGRDEPVPNAAAQQTDPPDSDGSEMMKPETAGQASTDRDGDRVIRSDSMAAQPRRTINSVRVPAGKLDSLLSHSGELLIARGRLSLRCKEATDLADFAAGLRSQWKSLQQAWTVLNPQCDDQGHDLIRQTGEQIAALAKRVDSLATGIEQDDRLLKQTCGRLDDEIYRVRMLPFAEACVGLERVVRDVAKAGGKSVRLKIVGAEVEVDRSVLEGLKDPLLHLIRNAVDHGIESPADRLAAGKPETATVTVSASLRGGQVEVQVQDDGRGFDLNRICQVAKQRGLEIPADAHLQSRLVLHPGFSTAPMITDISGRGVGMDVVQSRIESLHGELSIAFEPQQWTRMTMRVPLTLTTIRCLLVRSGNQSFAIPTAAVECLVRVASAKVRQVAGRDALFLRERAISVIPLSDALRLKSAEIGVGDSSQSIAIVLSADQQEAAVTVDEVIAEQDVLVKNLGKRIERLRHFSGCTLLPTGRIALVINAANLVRTVNDPHTVSRTPPTTGTSFDSRGEPRSGGAKRVLLADDSMTTRILLKNILETAGYDVVDVTDGEQAFKILAQHAGDEDLAFDAVVSDVDMPRMNGFELTTQIRGFEPAAEIPIVLVTARGTDEDKKQGIMAGANAYIVKDSFDQRNLLNTLTQLV